MKIPQGVLNKIKNKKWYHQRFDGSPMYLFSVGEAETLRENRKPYGTEAMVRVCYFNKDGTADWYLDMADVERGAKVMVSLAKKEKHLSKKLMARWAEDEKRFDDFFTDFQPRQLRGLSDKELLKLYNLYYDLFLKRFTSSAIIDHFALGTDQLIAEILRRELKLNGSVKEFTSLFSIATSCTHQSFINKAEIELLKIALSKVVRDRDIEEYQKKFFWISNNYYKAKVLSVKFFKKEILDRRKNLRQARADLLKLENVPLFNAKKKTALLNHYKLSFFLRNLLEISDDFTWWQDERKKSTYQNIHLGTMILGEMARRLDISSESTKYLLPAEVGEMFTKKIPSAAELSRRQKGCAFVAWEGGYYVCTGGEMEILRKRMFKDKQEDNIIDIRGLTASVGIAKGPVCIIKSAEQINKVKTGDVLVAVMTRPDYIAGMKKAAAIVTNEGGITCHAAIVSRELGIPCIIGTKIATQVFKDGDMVEVNANHGVVKKIL